ncbi:MAG: SDR family NAD(P)-dependent oxidoreductase [Bryobacteraceae bacterium]
MRIEKSVVLITGASRGIGAACASVFRARGARLALAARSEDLLKAVARPDELVAAGDVTRDDERARIVERTLERFGRVDILINNAGVGLYAPAWRAPLADARRMFDLNFFAALGMIQLVVPAMRAGGGGTIVNVGSVAGKMTLPWFTLYSSTKYALGSLSDGLRMELRRDRIRVMQVCPGYVQTGFQQHVLDGRPPGRIQRGRKMAITAEQCAEAIARGVERDARTVIAPAWLWAAIAVARLFPGPFDRYLAGIYDEAG